jgi:hypothetical protein
MNRKTTFVLFVIVVLLGAYVLFVQSPKDKAAAEATPTLVGGGGVVWSMSADQILEVRIVDLVKNRRVGFAKSSANLGVWSMTEPEPATADQNAAASAAASFTNLHYSTIITTATDLSGFGVLTPTYTIELKLADGSQLKLAVGNKTPTDIGYYVLRDNETSVLVVDTGTMDTVLKLLDTPPLVPTPTPTPTPNPTLPPVAPFDTPTPRSAVSPTEATPSVSATP